MSRHQGGGTGLGKAPLMADFPAPAPGFLLFQDGRFFTE